MDKEKVVVILLLVTIILSIVSVVVTYSLNIGDIKNINIKEAPPTKKTGNVELEIIEAPTGGEGQ